MNLVIVMSVLAVAFTGEAIFGFGAGLVSIPILSQIYSVKEAVTLLLSFQFLVAILIIKANEHIEWGVVKRALPAVMIATVAGTLSLAYLSETLLRGILLFLIVSYLAKEVFYPNLKLGKKDSKLFAAFGGSIGGWFQGVLGMGGPGFIIYLNELGLNKHQFRTTILLLYFFCNLIRVGISVSTGLFTKELLTLTLYCLPVVALALYVGDKVHYKVPESVYKKFVYGLLVCSTLSISYKLFITG